MILKQLGKVSMGKKRTGNLKELFVLTFDHPILLGKVNAAPLMEISILRKQGLKMKMGGHHVKKTSNNRKCLGFGINQICPSCPTMVFHNGDHILSSRMGLVPIRPSKVNVNEFKMSNNI